MFWGTGHGQRLKFKEFFEGVGRELGVFVDENDQGQLIAKKTVSLFSQFTWYLSLKLKKRQVLGTCRF